MTLQSKVPEELYHSTRRLLAKLPTKFILTTTTILTVLAFILNIFMAKHLYEYGLHIVADIQQGYTTTGKIVNNLLSSLLDPVLVTTMYAIFLLTAKNKEKVVALFAYLMINTYLCTVIKAAFQETRPYWRIQSIDSLGWYCPMDWGNPSGHSWYSIIFYQPLIIEYIGLGKKARNLIFPFLVAILVPFSRLYLGAHNVNQVVFGLLIGLSSLVMYRFYYERKLKNLILDFKLRSNESIVKRKLYKLLFVHIILFMVPIIVFWLNPQAFFTKEALKNIQFQCAKSPQKMKGLNNTMLMASAIINLAFGIVYGIYNSQKLSLFYIGDWKIRLKKKRKMAAKIAIDLIMLLLPLLIIYIYGFFEIKNMILQYSIVCFSLTLSGYLYMKFSPILQVRFNVIELLEQ